MQPHRSRQRGIGLIDTLLAALIVGFGMLVAAQFHRALRAAADVAADRSVAVRLADDRIEALRRTTGLAALADADEAVAAGAAGTTFTIERRLGPVDGPQRALRLAVRWTDRRGAAQRVDVASALTAVDGARSGALVVVPPQGAAPRVAGRSVHIPPDAADLGDGRSAWRPDPAAPATWLFDNRSARVLSRCTGPGANGCDGVAGQFAAGSVRFSAAADPAAADDVPQPAFIAVVPTGAAFAQPAACIATPHVRGTERSLRWACVIYATGPWSARIDLQPQGWTLGGGVGQQRVCRLAADLDASGVVDAPFEHPAAHSGVTGPLTHQNFLVVPGMAVCPGAPAAILAPTPNGVFADLGTQPHQP